VAGGGEGGGVGGGIGGGGCGLGGGAEGGAAAVGHHIRGAAVAAAGLVPGVEGDSGAHRAVEVGVGHEADAGAGVGGQQPRGGRRRIAERGPVAPAVGAELPATVGVVRGDDGDPLQRAGVRIGDAVAAGGGDDAPDQVPAVGRRILVEWGQGHVAAVVEGGGVVDG